jgi:hypothetical protein
VTKKDLLKLLKAELAEWRAEYRQRRKYNYSWYYAQGRIDALLFIVGVVKELPAESEEK